MLTAEQGMALNSCYPVWEPSRKENAAKKKKKNYLWVLTEIRADPDLPGKTEPMLPEESLVQLKS